MEETIYTVRAMPAQGHDRRWCTGRPFTRTSIDVKVVESPSPHRKFRENGVETNKIEVYSYEITALELEELKRDRYLAVSIKGNPDASVDAVNDLKAEILKLKAQMERDAKQFQSDTEELRAFKVGAASMAEESGKQLAAARQQIATLEAQLSERSSKKK